MSSEFGFGKVVEESFDGAIQKVTAELEKEGFGVLSGDDAITMPLLAAGIDGVISVVANAFPKTFGEMVHFGREGSIEKSREAHYDLLDVTGMFFAEGNPGGVKASLAKQGVMKPIMRQPLYPISNGLKAQIEKETDRLLS